MVRRVNRGLPAHGFRHDCRALARNCDFDLLPAQTDAWLEQIRLLQAQLVGLHGSIFLEFSIPRMGRRIDAVLLIGSIVFVLEFKVGESEFDRAAVDQVWDYGLDLKNFHEASHSASIIPILVVTAADKSPPVELRADDDLVYRPILANSSALRSTLDLVLRRVAGNSIDAHYWPSAPYRPTPSIIEAARALYAQHSVEAIARYDAGAQNLRVTSRRVEELVDEARAHAPKVHLLCYWCSRSWQDACRLEYRDTKAR